MASSLSRYADRFRQFRSEINPGNYGVLIGAIFAAAVGFLVGQAVFNRTLIRWLSDHAPSTDPSYLRSHQGALLPWLLLALVCLIIDLLGSLWLAYLAFRLVWQRRSK